MAFRAFIVVIDTATKQDSSVASRYLQYVIVLIYLRTYAWLLSVSPLPETYSKLDHTMDHTWEHAHKHAHRFMPLVGADKLHEPREERQACILTKKRSTNHKRHGGVLCIL